MDLARFYLRVRDGRVMEARFQTYGCGPTIAAASAATEVVDGLRRWKPCWSSSAARVEARGGRAAGRPRRHAADVVALGAAGRPRATR